MCMLICISQVPGFGARIPFLYRYMHERIAIYNVFNIYIYHYEYQIHLLCYYQLVQLWVWTILNASVMLDIQTFLSSCISLLKETLQLKQFPLVQQKSEHYV